MRLEALAKINLSLEILNRRDDGFHNIVTVLQTVDLSDELEFHAANDISVEGDIEMIPNDENLVYRAAHALRNEIGTDQGARIKVRKRIPMAAGLGGGSSDAAATLLGLCQLWEHRMGRSELLAIAANLGSDVPFFLYGGTALAEGRGERVSPVPTLRDSDFVLVVPPLEMAAKTATIYRGLDRSDFTDGELTKALVRVLRKKQSLSQEYLYNALTRVALNKFDELVDYWSRFELAGASNIQLCGAGPTLFSLVGSRQEAELLQRGCGAEGLEAFVVSAQPTSYNLR